MTYKVQEPLKPRSLTGISNGRIEQHWQLYEAYVSCSAIPSRLTCGNEADRKSQGTSWEMRQ